MMPKSFTRRSLVAVAALIVMLAAVPAEAGSYVVAPGATARVDVADRNGFTTITVINTAGTPGSFQFPAGSSDIAVPAHGRTDLYDRYSRSPSGGAYVTVINTGSVPLQVISRYTVTIQLP